jgi:hypothetical protein
MAPESKYVASKYFPKKAISESESSSSTAGSVVVVVEGVDVIGMKGLGSSPSFMMSCKDARSDPFGGTEPWYLYKLKLKVKVDLKLDVVIEIWLESELPCTVNVDLLYVYNGVTSLL